MKPMDLLGCHIELLTQLVDLLTRDHVETYLYRSSKPYGHIYETSGPTYILSRPICKLTYGPTYRHNGHTCNPTNLFIRPYGHTCKPYGSICKTYGTSYRPYGHTWTHSSQTNYTMNMDMP